MKVLIINTRWDGASIGKIAYQFCRKLCESGHEAMLIYGIGEDNVEDDNVIRLNLRIEPKLHFRYNLITGYHDRFGYIGTRRILKKIKEFKPDIIQLYNIHGYYLNEVRLYKYLSKLNIPVVYGMLDEYPYLGYCCYAFDCDKFKTGCIGCEYKADGRYMNSLFFNRARETYLAKEKAYNSIKKIMFTGPKWVLERANESGLLRGRDLREIDEFIDCENIFTIRNSDKLRNKLGIDQSKIVLLDVAPSNDKRKGVSYFVSLAEIAEKRYPGKYVFINVGYQGGFASLPANFIPVPYVYDQKELAEYYSMADAFICTSMADTMPNSCLDSLACGTPIIGFDITGVPYVAEEPLGRFAKAGDVDSMFTLIEGVSRKTNEIKEACREYAVNRYSINTYYEKQMAIYKEILN